MLAMGQRKTNKGKVKKMGNTMGNTMGNKMGNTMKTRVVSITSAPELTNCTCGGVPRFIQTNSNSDAHGCHRVECGCGVRTITHQNKIQAVVRWERLMGLMCKGVTL